LTTIPSIAQKRAFWNLLLKLIKDNQLTMKTFVVPPKQTRRNRQREGRKETKEEKKKSGKSHVSLGEGMINQQWLSGGKVEKQDRGDPLVPYRSPLVDTHDDHISFVYSLPLNMRKLPSLALHP